MIDFLKSVNEQLIYSKKKLIKSGNEFQVISDDAVPKIVVTTKRISTGYVAQLLEQGLDDLKDGDFDSLVTKSRTILESVFIQVLKDHDINFKENGNLEEYRGEVVKALGMKMDMAWNPRVKKWWVR